MRFAFRGGKTEFLPPDEINLVAINLLLIPQIGQKVKPAAGNRSLGIYILKVQPSRNREGWTFPKKSESKIEGVRHPLQLFPSEQLRRENKNPISVHPNSRSVYPMSKYFVPALKLSIANLPVLKSGWGNLSRSYQFHDSDFSGSKTSGSPFSQSATNPMWT